MAGERCFGTSIKTSILAKARYRPYRNHTHPASAGFFICNHANLGYFHQLMTPETLQHCLDDIGWTPDMLARKLECHVSLVDAWLSGEMEVPIKAKVWLTTLAACHRAAEEGRPTSLRGKKAPF